MTEVFEGEVSFPTRSVVCGNSCETKRMIRWIGKGQSTVILPYICPGCKPNYKDEPSDGQ